MHISQILDTNELTRLIKEGYISSRPHPSLDLFVLNYTKEAQFDRAWSNETLKCRGLIVDTHGNIVGNCMPKFFNDGEPDDHVEKRGLVHVTDKLDGSMITVCFYNDELVVATRGSFESEQALHARELIEKKYYYDFKTLCDDDSTAVAEVIYPANRIVVDYNGMDDLVLLGVLGNEYLCNGKQHWTPADKIYSWPGPVAKRFSARSYSAALKLPVRENAEGFVLYFEKTGQRVKIKYDRYIELHRLVSNYSKKNIAKMFLEQKDVADYIASLPDELHKQALEDVYELKQRQHQIMVQTINDFHRISTKDRKAFAALALKLPRHDMLFDLFENKDVKLKIWKEIVNECQANCM